MKRILAVVVFLTTISAVGIAQDFSKVEVFGGYSVLRADIPVEDAEYLQGDFYIPGYGYATISNMKTTKILKKGFTGSFTYNINRAVGIEAAFRYHKDNLVDFDVTFEGQTVSAHVQGRDIAFGAGPKFAFRNNSALTPFVHALVGMDDVQLSAAASIAGTSANQDVESHTGFGLTLGGGFDVGVNDNIAIRLVQADYYMSRHFEETQNNFIFSFGVVIGLGK